MEKGVEIILQWGVETEKAMLLEGNPPNNVVQRTRGVCLREMRTERIRETSFACLLVLGLKSQRRATRSHSDPGLSPSVSARKASSDALRVGGRAGREETRMSYSRGRHWRRVKHGAQPITRLAPVHKIQTDFMHFGFLYTTFAVLNKQFILYCKHVKPSKMHQPLNQTFRKRLNISGWEHASGEKWSGEAESIQR